MKRVEFAKIQYTEHGSIKYEGKKMVSGRTYFWYNPKDKELYIHQFSKFSLLMHRLFGYKKQFNRENFWDYLQMDQTTKQLCPQKGKFSQAMEPIFRKLILEKQKFIYIYKEPVFIMDQLEIENRRDEFLQDFHKQFTETPPDSSEKTRIGKNMLHFAAQFGFVDLARKAIQELSYDINETDRLGNTALMFAIQNKKDDVIDLLLQADARLTQQAPSKSSAIHLAAFVGNSTVIDKAIEKKCDLNEVEETIPTFGTTPLQIAAKKGYLTIAEKLVDNGAKIEANQCGAIQGAIQSENADLVRTYLNQVEASAIKEFSFKLFSAAIETGNTEILTIVMDHPNFDINARHPLLGETLWNLALSINSDLGVQKLLEKKADVHRKSSGRSALELARSKKDDYEKLGKTAQAQKYAKWLEEMEKLAAPSGN